MSLDFTHLCFCLSWLRDEISLKSLIRFFHLNVSPPIKQRKTLYGSFNTHSLLLIMFTVSGVHAGDFMHTIRSTKKSSGGVRLRTADVAAVYQSASAN